MDQLVKKGWHLSGTAATDLLVGENKSKFNFEKMMLNTDLSKTGEKFILEYLQNHNENMNCILQISKIKNIAVSAQKQDLNTQSRMLRLTLTDGFDSCVAIEMDAIKDINANSYPGIKVAVHGKVEIINGILLLSSKNVKVLGGHVEHLYNKWQLAKELSNHNRIDNDSADRPPPFVQFGQKIKSNVEIKSKVMSNTGGSGDPAEASENAEFKKHRTAAIGEVTTNQHTKNFSQKPQLIKNTENNNPRKQYNDNNRSSETLKPAVNVYVKESDKIDEELLLKFEKMGFNKTDSINALKATSNNFDWALETLLSSSEPTPSTSDHRREKRNEGKFNRRKGKRGQRDAEESYEVSSGPATLFDYLESKIPAEKQSSHNKNIVTQSRSTTYSNDRNYYKSDDGPSSSGHFTKQNTDQRNNYKPQYGDRKTKERNTFQKKFSDKFDQGRGEYSGNAPLNKQQYSTNNYKENTRNKSEYDAGGANRNRYEDRNDQSFNNHKNKNYSKYSENSLKYSSGEQTVTYPPKDDNYKGKSRTFKNSNYNKPAITSNSATPHETFKSNKNSSDSKGNLKLSANSKPFKHSQPQFKSADAGFKETNYATNKRPPLQIGMNCQAKYWEDGKFYPAVIKNIHPTAPTAVVLFTEYGNYEEVSTNDVMPPDFFSNNSNNYQSDQRKRNHKPTQNIYVPPSQRS